MNDFFNAIRADLTSRRMLPLLVVVCAALLAAVAYTVAGAIHTAGPSLAQPPAAADAEPDAGMHLTAAARDEGIAEMVDGSRGQHGGDSHDPFAAVPGSKPASSTATPATSAPHTPSAVSTSSTRSSALQGSGSTSPSEPAPHPSTGGSGIPATPEQSVQPPAAPTATGTKPASKAPTFGHTRATGRGTGEHRPSGGGKPAKKAPARSSAIFTVSLSTQRSLAETSAPTSTESATTTTTTTTTTATTPAAAPPVASAATTVANVARGRELPDAGRPLLVFAGVMKGARAAVFEIVGEATPSDPSKCLPGSLQCEALRLSPGEREELQYTGSAGKVHTYTVELASIAHGEVKAGSRKATSGASKAGLALLAQYSLPEGLRYSRARGLIVKARH